MESRKWWPRAACLGLVVLVAYGFAQPPAAPLPADAVPNPGVTPVPDVGFPVARPSPAPPAPATIDAVLAEIAKVRVQRQALERKEQALVQQLRTMLREQREKLAKLGI